MTTKILTIRVPAPVYSELCTSAAELGVAISSHVRRLIEQGHRADEVSLLRVELLARFDSLTPALARSPTPPPAIEEILLLSRATAAHLNPQLVAQVRAKLNNQK